MSRNIVDENGNLIQIAGKGIGVAEWGTPIENWLSGHTTSATAITADKDGVLVVRATTHGTGTITIYCNNNILMKTDSGYDFSDEIPIKKGFSYYITSSNVILNLSTFYPFKTNNDLQMVREKYSTEETVIGEYLGKPLYRRVVITTAIITTSTWSWGGLDSLINSMNIKQFIKCSRTLLESSGSSICEIRVSKVSGGDNGFLTLGSNAPIGTEIILEYTKTTD